MFFNENPLRSNFEEGFLQIQVTAIKVSMNSSQLTKNYTSRATKVIETAKVQHRFGKVTQSENLFEIDGHLVCLLYYICLVRTHVHALCMMIWE